MNPLEGNQGSRVPSEEEFKRDIVALEPKLQREAYFLLTKGAPKTIEAKDLVQETYKRALEGRQDFDGKHLEAWLKTILTNVFRDQLRRVANTDTVVRGEDADAAIDARVTPPNQAAAVELSEVASRMSKLPPGQLQALEMSAEGYKSPEAAAEMNITDGTFRVHLSRARKALRNLEDGDDKK